MTTTTTTTEIETALIVACKEGDTKTIAGILQQEQANANADDDTSSTPIWKKPHDWTDEEDVELNSPAIFIAIDYNRIEVVKLLLRTDPTVVHQMDSNDYSPIQWAVSTANRNIDLVRFLVEEGGARVEQDTLDLAKEEEEHTEIVSLLMKHVDFNYADLHEVDDIMIKASREGDVKKVQELIAEGYDFDKWKEADGETYQEYSPIYIAMKNGHIEVIREFLQAGVEAELHSTHFHHEDGPDAAAPAELSEEQIEAIRAQMVAEMPDEEEEATQGTHGTDDKEEES